VNKRDTSRSTMAQSRPTVRARSHDRFGTGRPGSVGGASELRADDLESEGWDRPRRRMANYERERTRVRE
jgi:hypothetical protein